MCSWWVIRHDSFQRILVSLYCTRPTDSEDPYLRSKYWELLAALQLIIFKGLLRDVQSMLHLHKIERELLGFTSNRLQLKSQGIKSLGYITNPSSRCWDI